MRRFVWFVLTTILLLVFLGVAGSVWFSTGFIQGQEVCPYTFQIRRFSYWQPTFFKHGYLKTTQLNDRFILALSLTGTAPPPIAAERWDLCGDNYTSRLSRDVAASFLASVISRQDASGEYRWVVWSQQHPDLATVLWLWVQRLAIARAYVVCPAVFQHALEHESDTPESFSASLEALISDEIMSLQQASAAAGRRSEADDLSQFHATWFKVEGRP